MKLSIVLIVGFVAAIWAVEIVNGSDHQLNTWGILPRTRSGLIGIPISPFLHGGILHVLSNTLPFIVLAGFVALRGGQRLITVSVVIVLLGGVGVWALGRGSYHVGASGLVFGYFGYLLASGWYDRSLMSIIIAVFVFFIYGGLLWGVLPTVPFVSWEGHLFGLLAGVIAARLWRRPRLAEA